MNRDDQRTKDMRMPGLQKRLIASICIFVAIFVCVLTIITVRAEDNVSQLKERAMKYYYGKSVPQNYEKALELYLKAADQGDAQAQFIAGGMYFQGLGAPVDYTQAFDLLYMAANSGESTVESQKVLAQSFLMGRGVAQNYQEAKYWYTMASEEGDPEAQNELGVMYFTGNGIEKDLVQAFQLFQSSADNGFALAQYNVGIMYYTGDGAPRQDLVEAYIWFTLSAMNGHEPAQAAIKVLAADLTVEEIQLARKKVRLQAASQ